MTVNDKDRREHSGAPFGRPNPLFLSKSWRIKHGVLAPKDLTPLTPLAVSSRAGSPGAPVKTTTTLTGQDSVTASSLARGKAVYAGYYNGSFANLTTIANRVGPGPIIVSVSPNGANGARAIDIESGDAVPSDAPRFWHNSNHGGTGYGQKDEGIPIFYTSAGDVQSVINYLTWAGISRSKYLIWSAHWIGYHICGESVCGYPQADATQYSDAGYVDNDVWYSYCFSGATTTSPPPPTTPVSDLPSDWIFQPVRGLALNAVNHNSVNVSFTSPGTTINGHPNMYAPMGVASYDVAIWANDYVNKAAWPGYPVSMSTAGSNPRTFNGTGLNPDSSYTLGIRAVATGGTHAGPWAYLSFQTTS